MLGLGFTKWLQHRKTLQPEKLMRLGVKPFFTCESHAFNRQSLWVSLDRRDELCCESCIPLLTSKP